MQGKRILIVGCGKIGLPLARLLARKHHVWGLKRRFQANETQLKFIFADISQSNALPDLPENIDYLVYCLSPSERNEPGYRNTYITGLRNIVASLRQKAPLKRLYFISSTSVYHQNDNGWVDEQSETRPTRFAGRVLLEAEELARHCGQPSTCIRFSGIYGGDRRQLISQVRRGEAHLSERVRTTNRIHEEDCIDFIQHLIEADMKGQHSASLYLASDSCPADLNEVLVFLSAKLGIGINRDVSSQSLEAGTTSRRSGNKKCSNSRMLASGYCLKYPSYREGYLAMLEAESRI